MGFLIKFRTLETEYQVENLATSSTEVVLVNSQFSPIADTISILYPCTSLQVTGAAAYKRLVHYACLLALGSPHSLQANH